MIFSLISNLEFLDVILASGSPRRYELLSTTGIKFKVVPSGIDENKIKVEDNIQFVKEVSYQKGLAVAKDHPKKLVISADTIVVLGKHIFGKPENEEQATQMLEALSGKTHTVYTAFSLFLLKYDKSVTEVASTDVTMRNMEPEEIFEYVNTGEPMDKAGAYAIQGQGAMLVEKIVGSHSNVVGFPLAEFYVTLDHFLKGLALHN